MMDTEALKATSLIAVLETHYGAVFQRRGSQHVCLSPLGEEREPSFFVRQCRDGHWVFKDFSSGLGGSLIDFVMYKEGFTEVGAALAHLSSMLGGKCEEPAPVPPGKGRTKPYDLAEIHQAIGRNKVKASAAYLRRRGIDEALIEEMREAGILLHNRHRGKSYCCFAVYDRRRALRCLDNHEIGGGGKFVLGSKCVFTMDWDRIEEADEVFVCESIIDYLSIKTMAGRDGVGLALLGNGVRFSPELLGGARVIVSALDGDAGGFRALLDLREAFPTKAFRIRDFGKHKDANEQLQAERKARRATDLSPRDKLKIYEEFIAASNKSAVARKWGINRGYMYEIVGDCQATLLGEMGSRQKGRRPEKMPTDLLDARKRLKELEAEKEREATEKEGYLAQSAFLQLQLKWAKESLAEHEGRKPNQNRQLKKKKKRRR